jgi:hypothetical protein
LLLKNRHPVGCCRRLQFRQVEDDGGLLLLLLNKRNL